MQASGKSSRKRDREAEFNSLLMTWAHPSSVRQSEDSKRSFKPRMGNRRQYVSPDDWVAWEASFCSAYYGIRTRASPYFYFETSNCTILFVPGEKPSRRKSAKPLFETRAVFTHSNAVVREALIKAGIPFEEPLRRTKGHGKQLNMCRAKREPGLDEDEIIEDMKAYEAAKPGATRSLAEVAYLQDDRSVRAALVVIGRKNVHALFNHLLNTTTRRATDERPILLSPVPFIGANLETAKIIKSSSVLINSVKKYKIVLEGCFLPLSAARLMALIAQTQGGFEATCSARSDSGNLNVLGVDLSCMGLNISDVEFALSQGFFIQESMLRMRKVYTVRDISYTSGNGYQVSVGNPE